MIIEIHRIKEDEGMLLRTVRLAALTDSPGACGAKLEDERKKPMVEFEEAARSHSQSEKSTTFLATQSNSAVGQIGAFFETTEGRAYICAMWVSPKVRRQAIGTRLFNAAAEWLHQRGAEQIHAWVADSNEAAIEFYRQLGFVATETKMPLLSDPSELETLYVYSS